MAERNNSDALNELMNGVDSEKGIADLIDEKLDKNANAVSATKLTNARTIQTNLSSTNSASFDGTGNVTPGVSGTLPVANGGTGQTNLANVTVGAATKATQDGSGNIIAQTYAKLSDIPSSVDAYSKTESDNRYFQKSASSITINNGIEITNDSIYGKNYNTYKQTIHFETANGKISISTLNGEILLENGSYEFKSDGIYLNGNKITS